MKHFNIRGVMGKGGMGPKTLKGCMETPGVYFHAIGGAASFLAQTVQRVLGVYKLEEFGVPEAMWVIEVKKFPVVVTMDSHGESQHKVIDEEFPESAGGSPSEIIGLSFPCFIRKMQDRSESIAPVFFFPFTSKIGPNQRTACGTTSHSFLGIS